LGAFCAASSELSLEALVEAIKKRFSAKLQEANIESAKQGFEFIKNSMKG
jgi:Pyruvate/2-oxoacid:ferredoxin oxidoreductase gamma subunit